MATLTNNNGRRIVQVYVRDRRRTISVGRVSDRSARDTAARIQQLADAVNLALPVPADVARWVGGVHEKLHRKLVKHGLVPGRQTPQSLLLKDYFDGYVKRRSDLKPTSVENLQGVGAFAVEHFGATRDLRGITRGDVKDWLRALQAKYSPATVALHIKKMRQLLADAKDRRLIDENPFLAVRAPSQSNPAKMRYVSKSDIATVIDACGDWEWRLLFALARYAGLRVPSETRALRWIDIDFIKNRFVVHSSKTEHHAGKATRVVPIFPELLPRILEAQAQSDSGTDYVFDRLRCRENLATQAQRLIERAGLKPWPKTWQNLRSSCETDLATTHTLPLACVWIGNSAAIAMKHYVQVRDVDYQNAARGAASSSPDNSGSDSEFVATLRKWLDKRSRQDFNAIVNPARSLQAAHESVQRALHSTQTYAAKFRRQLIQNLRQSVDQAKARGGGR